MADEPENPPISLAKERVKRTGRPDDWTGYDVILQALKDADSGEVIPDKVLLIRIEKNGDLRTTTNADLSDRLGMIEFAKQVALNSIERAEK